MMKSLILIVSLVFSTLALAGPAFAEADHCEEPTIEYAMIDQDHGHQHDGDHNCDCACALQHLQCHTLKANVLDESWTWQQSLFDQVANFDSSLFKDSPYLESPKQPPRNA